MNWEKKNKSGMLNTIKLVFDMSNAKICNVNDIKFWHVNCVS